MRGCLSLLVAFGVSLQPVRCGNWREQRLSQVKEWAKRGLSKSWVRDQLAKYSSSLAKGGDKLKNSQLVHRKELMEKILELWK